ncbi:hypothetical protein [Zobellia nedashkovskayae]|uniref:hypothetical protein n=1 Tax=Zobellia nedashkovskayae TaxID=2779510 RepID=UPI00188C7563|nr:hypothetical protein [Zobellia nedashkovskayae]
MKKIKSILFFFLAFITFSFFMEIFLSSAAITVPSISVDKEKGERYVANKTTNSLFTTEGFGLAKTNSLGWYGKECNKNTRQDINIGVIGNSFVAARQVFERNNFVTKLEENLNNSLEPSVAVFNFGKEALPTSELLYLVNEVENDYKLDYNLVLLNERSFEGLNRMVPFYEKKQDKFVLNTSFKNSSKYKIYRTLESVGLAHSSLTFLMYRVKNQLQNAAPIVFGKLYDIFQKNGVQKSQPSSLTELDRDIIREIDKKQKIVFLLDLEPKKKAVVQECIKNSTIIDLEPILDSIRQNYIDPNFWKISGKEGHWNNTAHDIVGKALSKELIQKKFKTIK